MPKIEIVMTELEKQVLDEDLKRYHEVPESDARHKSNL